jgi:integrase
LLPGSVTGPIDRSKKSQKDLLAYRSALIAQVSARTANHDLCAVRMLFRAARRDGVIDVNPAEFVDGIRSRNSESDAGAIKRRAFTLDELRAILASADPEWQSMIKFGLYTGQRLSDIASLSWASVDLEKGELRLCTRKTGKRLILPLAAPLQQHLEQMPSADDLGAPLHPRAARTLGRHGRAAALSNQFAKILADAGLRPRTDHQKHAQGRSARRASNELSFHSLRKTATTLLHEAGVPQAVVQSLIGHDSVEVHQLYVSIGRDALARAAASLPVL